MSSGITSVVSGPLFGREAEIAGLEAAAKSRDAGDAPVVVVHGESGIGKTSLVARFAERAAGRESTVLWGACFAESGPPYGPWVDAIDGYFAGLSRERVAELLAGDAPVLSTIAPGRKRG